MMMWGWRALSGHLGTKWGLGPIPLNNGLPSNSSTRRTMLIGEGAGSRYFEMSSCEVVYAHNLRISLVIASLRLRCRVSRFWFCTALSGWQVLAYLIDESLRASDVYIQSYVMRPLVWDTCLPNRDLPQVLDTPPTQAHRYW